MRWIAVLVALPLIGAAPPAGEAPRSSPWATPVLNPHNGVRCPETPMSLARQRAERPESRRLAELPMGTAFAAVDHRVDNCPAPVPLGALRR